MGARRAECRPLKSPQGLTRLPRSIPSKIESRESRAPLSVGAFPSRWPATVGQTSIAGVSRESFGRRYGGISKGDDEERDVVNDDDDLREISFREGVKGTTGSCGKAHPAHPNQKKKLQKLVWALAQTQLQTSPMPFLSLCQSTTGPFQATRDEKELWDDLAPMDHIHM
ncbi:unnamed protein product [Bursaphelenchus xylophilus]|uniref:(pine wood nematode) hypothetical protein n=1 Tax=Bursaphelenchus xylophilus TaxID=6326 RepID=A0A1I7RRC9_BURXY|nr:unnamed protein product [Bursaphelenchus xylophilus]CAG9130948.1 unnamed protein product [Bursaphelenchus xylophilus]